MSVAFGDSVVIDCHYANDLVKTPYKRLFELIIRSQPLAYTFLRDLHERALTQLDNLNLCEYSLSLHGMISD